MNIILIVGIVILVGAAYTAGHRDGWRAKVAEDNAAVDSVKSAADDLSGMMKAMLEGKSPPEKRRPVKADDMTLDEAWEKIQAKDRRK